MFNKDEISALLRRLCAYLSFDKQDEEKVNEAKQDYSIERRD